MASTDIRVENIKCGGCAASITRRLKAIPGVIDMRVDVAVERPVTQEAATGCVAKAC